jgi:hypothetical protein
MNNELTDEVLVERLIQRIESGNTLILQTIGETIKDIGTLTPTQVRRLQQMIKYGARYDTILERLSKITNLNIKEIDNIFNEYAKRDYAFSKKFYDYKGIDYIPFNEFTALKQQTQALANITKGTYRNLTRTSAIGFIIKDAKGKPIFYKLTDAYQYAIDRALMSISQGKSTYDIEMTRLMKSLGESGIKCIDYASGSTRRLDSAIRMNLREGMRNLHNETQRLLGNEFGADGVEISVHENPATDHEDLQGRQFSYEEFDKLQNNQTATDYKGITYTHEHRPISEYNCYHNVFAIVLGVSEPQYTNEQLEQIKQRNEKGFVFEGKHYTMYEGTQLQRKIETEVRKQKDIQILGRSSDNQDLILQSQNKITQLTTKYKELVKASGLSSYKERMKVSVYRRIKTK